jgi:hypothetical protein
VTEIFSKKLDGEGWRLFFFRAISSVARNS